MAGKKGKQTTSENEDIMAAIHEMEKNFLEKLEHLEEKVLGDFKKTVAEEISKVKNEFSQSLKALENRLTAIESKVNDVTNLDVGQTDDLSLNIVIRNFEQNEDENVLEKVNGFFKDKLKLKKVKVNNAVRKKTFRQNMPGVIVAKCATKEDKESIMKAKSILNRSSDTAVKKIFIDHDKSRVQRQLESNMRLIVQTVAKDKLELRGSRVIPKQNRQSDLNQNATR